MKNAVISNDLHKSSNLVAIPLGIEPSDYEAVSHFQLDKKNDQERQPCTIVFVGRLARYKGIDVLIRALTLLPGVELVIAGEGPLLEPSRQLVSDLSLTDRVRFLGRVSHEAKVSLLKRITVFAFPSTETTEAFGISQLEAMILGAPVVSSNLPTGVTDVAVADKTALLAEPGDHSDLAEKLKRIIEEPMMAKRLAEQAYVHVIKNFTMEKTTRATLELFFEKEE